jgi:hypothetical protein
MAMSRVFRGQRTIRILFRTVHIGSVVTFMGAVLCGQTPTGSLHLLLFSGAYLVAEQFYRYGPAYLRFASFWTVVTKVAILMLGLLVPQALVSTLWASLILGSLISHAPGRVRHFSLWGAVGPCAASKPTRECRGSHRGPGEQAGLCR